MKIIFTFICITFLSSFSLSAQWKQCNSGPYGIYPEAFGAIGSTLFLGGFNGVYRSLDSGATWSPTSLQLSNIARVQSFAVIGKTIFASSDDDEVFRSSDNGITWANVTNNLDLHDITIAANSSVLFACGYQSGYRSTDMGDTWTKIDMPNFVPTAFETIGSTVFALTSKGVYRSLDNGVKWNIVKYFGDTLKLSVLKRVGSVLYGKSFFLFYYSTDGGNYWEVPSTSFDPNYTECMDGNGKNLYAGTLIYGLFKSTNNGKSWKEIAFPKKNISAVFCYGDRVFVAEGDSIFVSRDEGKSWQSPTKGIFSQYISYTYANGSMIFGTATTNSYITGLFLSTDNGDSWAKISRDLTSDIIVADGKIFTIFYGYLLRSSDNGITWDTILDDLPNDRITSIAKIGSSIITGSRGIYKSTDYGTSWIEKSTGFPKEKYITSMITSGTTVYAVISDTTLSIYQSTDIGESWSKLTDIPRNKYIRSVSVCNSIIFIETEAGLFCSRNDGTTWDSLTIPTEYSFSIVSVGSSLFAGTDYGVYRSTDDGYTWTPINDGLTNLQITSLSISGTTLYAGTYGLGVWKIDVNTLEVDENKMLLHTAAKLNCYPNPATNSLTIDRTSLQFPENTPVHYTLSTLIGGKVMEFDNSEPKFTVMLDGVANGVYNLIAESGGTRAVVLVTLKK